MQNDQGPYNNRLLGNISRSTVDLAGLLLAVTLISAMLIGVTVVAKAGLAVFAVVGILAIISDIRKPKQPYVAYQQQPVSPAQPLQSPQPAQSLQTVQPTAPQSLPNYGAEGFETTSDPLSPAAFPAPPNPRSSAKRILMIGGGIMLFAVFAVYVLPILGFFLLLIVFMIAGGGDVGS